VKTFLESRGSRPRCVDMAEVVTDDLVIRPIWPLSQAGDERTSYSVPCFAMATGLLCVAFVYALSGSPLDALFGHANVSINLFVWAFILFGASAYLAYYFDGIVLLANRDRMVLRKWFREPRVVAISDLSRIVLCSINGEFSRGPARNPWRPAILFFNREGRCVMSLYARFRGEDLAKLWAMIGIRPEGSWSDRLWNFDLKRRFPGAF
jgi:hypothetical protein